MKKFTKTIPSTAFYLEGDKQTEALKRPLLNVLNMLSEKTQLAVNFEIPHGEEVDSVLDRQINVYVWGSPLCDTPTKVLEEVKLDSVTLTLEDGQKDSWDFSKVAELAGAYMKSIVDKNKNIIAVVENNNVFISLDLFHGVETYGTKGKNAIKVFEFIIAEASQYIITDKPKIEKLIDEMPLFGYVKGIIENASKMCEKKKSELESVEKSISSILKNLVVEQRRYTEIHKVVNSQMADKTEAMLLEKNRNSLLGLLKNGYTSIKWSGNTLKAMTEPIPIEFDGREFLLGGYEITLGLDGNIKIKNKKNPHDGYDHPHIRSGLPCWGNVSSAIGKLIAQLEFVPVLDMLLPYLGAYNPKDAYHRLGYWKNEDEELCGECGEVVDCCQC